MSRSRIPHVEGLPVRYELRRELHEGPYGRVVEAINRDRNATAVALKLLWADGTHAEVARAMFRREVAALKGLAHPAIVQILDWFEGENHLLGIELELVPGGASLATLFERVRTGQEPPPSPAWRLWMAAQLAGAVIEAHRREVIHRDIKPGNVLWSRDDDALKLADFGIATVLTLTAREASGMTLRQFYSPPFASPEQMMQRQAPTFQSDVYSFGLLVAALLALRAPAQTFAPAELDQLLEDVLPELLTGGVSEADLDRLLTHLRAALNDDPGQRPSITTIKDVLERLAGVFVPQPEAAVTLTETANNGLKRAGFVAKARIVEDLNTDLRIRLGRDDRGEFVTAFGRSLYAVLRPEYDDPECEFELRAVDAGENVGPTHEQLRRRAEPTRVRIRIDSGTGAPLLHAARELDRAATRRATQEIVDRARLVIRLERERLPVFEVHATVDGGKSVAGRERRIGRASGYAAEQLPKVEVDGGYLLKIEWVTLGLPPGRRNVMAARLGSTAPPEDPVFDDASVDDWYAMFDEVGDIDVLDDAGHLVGKATKIDKATNTLHVRTDKKRRLPKSGNFYVKDRQTERQLRQQEVAIDALARGEASRADLPLLLSEASVHHLGDDPRVELLQKGLVPPAHVRNLVNRILACKGIFCLQGPPGTGKTTIIAEVVAQMLELRPDSRILLCSQANDAVANAVERILKLRDELHRDWVIVRDVRAQRARTEGSWAGYDAAYRAFAQRIKKNATSDAGAGPIIDDWLRSVETGAHGVRSAFHGLVQVWGVTTARSLRPLQELDGASYDLVVIDEAAKATVGEVLVPMVHGQKFLLVGDPEQLPPFLENTTVEALEALGVSKEDAKYSLFEHLVDDILPGDHHDMLTVQFRMHPTIGDLVSRMSYGGKLDHGKDTRNRPLPPGEFDRPHRVLWVDVVGHCEFVGKSRANAEERETIVRLLTRLDADATAAGMKLTVAVIAAYRAQATLLRDRLSSAAEGWLALKVDAATVDAFQGREADVVVYSIVRTGDAEYQFLADGRRFNVALSRARSLLVLVGDRSGSRGTPKLRTVLDAIPEENQVSASLFAPKVALADQLAAAWGTRQKERP